MFVYSTGKTLSYVAIYVCSDCSELNILLYFVRYKELFYLCKLMKPFINLLTSKNRNNQPFG